MAAECEIAVGSGTCDVLAVGRCIDCERAFCQSHRDIAGGVVQVNVCSECGAHRKAEDRDKIDSMIEAARDRWARGGDRSPGEMVRHLIRAHPERAVLVNQLRFTLRRDGLFGKKHSVAVPEPKCSGWPIGEHQVQHRGREGSVMGTNPYETSTKSVVITEEGTCAVWYDEHQCYLEGWYAYESWTLKTADAQSVLFDEAQQLGVDLT